MTNSYSKNQGFTLLEVLIVTILTAVIAGFGIANYANSNAETRQMAMDDQLNMLHIANSYYFAKNKKYLDITTTQDRNTDLVGALNAGLNLTLSPDFEYTYKCTDRSCENGYIVSMQSGHSESKSERVCSGRYCPTYPNSDAGKQYGR